MDLGTNDTEHEHGIQQVQGNPNDEETQREALTSLEATTAESTLLDTIVDTQQNSLDATSQVAGGQADIGEETQIDHDLDYANHDHTTDEAARPPHQ